MAVALTSKDISPEVLAILAAAEIDGNLVRLTSPQLARPTYEAVDQVLRRLGGKWKGGKTRAHVFDRDPAPLLASVLGEGLMPAKNPDAYFSTPGPVVERLIGLADLDGLGPSDAILEPSAGTGAIADAIHEANPLPALYCVESDMARVQLLTFGGHQAERADFLEWVAPQPFARVVMNPPFSVAGDKLAYIPHIERAFSMLGSDGRLVAVAPIGFTFRSDRRTKGFARFVKTFGEWESLPDDAFKESGTGAKTVIVTLRP